MQRTAVPGAPAEPRGQRGGPAIMIRLAVITDEISQDFERALDVAAEYGIRSAELRGLWGANVMDLDGAARARAREILARRGFSVCGIASPLFKCHLRPEAQGGGSGPLHLARARGQEEQLALLERAIELAEYFGTNLIRIFAFWKLGAAGAPVDAATFAEIVAALEPAVRRAEAAGVVLGLENEHACILGTGVQAGMALDALPSPALRAVWDPGNAFHAGERPYPDGYAALRGRIAHVHVKDAERGPDGAPRWAMIGKGEIDYRGQFAALAADGYNGALSLETHYKAPGGDAEASSRACLDGLLQVLREAGVRVDTGG